MENEYLLNENFELFWACLFLVAAALILIIAYFMCKDVKAIVIEEDKNPIKYKIDGISMTFDAAVKYYYKELDRQRKKNTLHLLVYDSEHDNVMFDGEASKYFEKPC